MFYIELARIQKGWSQKQLEGVVRIHQTFISEIERGVGLPTPEQRERLARALDVPIDVLLETVPKAANLVADGRG